MKRTLYCLLLLLAVMTTGCENDLKTIMELDKKNAGVEKASGITIIYSQKAKVTAKLIADSMERHLEAPTFLEFTHGLHVDIYDDSLGTVESTVDAKHGKYMDGTADIFLWDNVVVKNKKGERLDTKQLNWDAKKQKFISNAKVRISTPTDTIRGTGLEANQDFSIYKILNPEGPFTVKDSALIQ
ncbi:LPS export ABC transporter periplasmic protein LptC [Chitinophaga costaii]|nr:LPS export ABC transporter periplasmic protein LptC [Chitinophaga costaii]